MPTTLMIDDSTIKSPDDVLQVVGPVAFNRGQDPDNGWVWLFEETGGLKRLVYVDEIGIKNLLSSKVEEDAYAAEISSEQGISGPGLPVGGVCHFSKEIIRLVIRC